MSGSETGLITSREPFTVALQNNPVPTQPVMQNMRVAFSHEGNPMYKAINPASPPYHPNSAVAGDGSAGGGGCGSTACPGLNMNMVGGSEPMKKKRGRPRKYGPDGPMGLALIPAASPQQFGGGLSSTPPASSGGSASPTFKKARGRPPGSGKKHQLQALGSTGLGFTPHVITVQAGEDVSSKILAFSQHGPRAVCVLSANGSISNVTLRQPATSGGTVTYEGRFEILSLSGSFLLTENGGQRSRTGGLSVSLSGPDGRVLGGGVAGLLIAASPIQVVVGSFIADGRKDPKPVGQMEPLSSGMKLTPIPGPTGTVPGSPQSRGTLSESSGGPNSPINNHNTNMTSMPWK